MRIEIEKTALRTRGRVTEGLAALVFRLVGGLIGGLLASAPAGAFSAAEVYRTASPSVVLILGFEDGGAGSSGTGTLLDRSGLVLTNSHVITRGESGRLYSNLVVYFKPKPISGDNSKDLTKPFLVDVVARDTKLDLALLRVKNAPPGIQPIQVGDSEEVDVGESVAAIGHPGGGGLWTLTTGTVSSKRSDQSRDIFQTDTAINPGNSGGPLLDEHARLIGVNTFVRRVNQAGLPLEGLNYSLRSRAALTWVNRHAGRRVAAVSRASAARPSRAAEPPPTPAPAARPAPAPSRPEPRLAEREPTPPAPPSRSAADPAPPAPPEPEPREPAPPPEPDFQRFEGPDGETYYGVPNPDIELDERLKYARRAHRELIERADRSVEEMDRLLDDYDNF